MFNGSFETYIPDFSIVGLKIFRMKIKIDNEC